MKACTFRYAVVCAYSGPFGERGDVLSRHRTYDAAVRAMNRKGDGGWLKVCQL
jgi:hypothetical protein